MPFVVTQNCIKCKYTDCVEVCPVDCFHEGPNMLVIDPDECIDCTLCEPECPIEAIMCDEDVPEDMNEFIELNAELSKKWPVINEMKSPPDDVEEWKEQKGKIKWRERGDFIVHRWEEPEQVKFSTNAAGIIENLEHEW